MCMFAGLQQKWECTVILLSFLVQILIFVEHCNQECTIWSTQNVISSRPVYDVVIGILSARDHFEQRQALRETWVGHVKIGEEFFNRVLVKFIIGNQPCPTPPQDRQDSYTCAKDELRNPVLDQDIISYRVPHGTTGRHYHRGPLGMDFKINFPIVITHLGVFDSGSDGLKYGLVSRLYDRISGDEVVNTTFSPDDPGQLIGGSRFKAVDEYVIPKGFEASIVAENFSESDPSNNEHMGHGETASGGGLITFRRVSRFGMIQGQFPENEESILEEPNQYAAGTFIYRAYATSQGEFSQDNQNKKDLEAKEREQRWKQTLDTEERRIHQEIQQYGDVLLVDAVDVYRNLSRKVLLFYKWAAENIEFNFTIKTDDDSFIDLKRIIKELTENRLRGKPKIWWSGFRTEWPVERFGKWREPDYSAPTYPAFACGAGNMLSADLVKWLARNANDLKHYQGEDVSMGIWLSSVGPTLVKDYRWACVPECDKDMFNSPENEPGTIRKMWANLEQCGSMCGCT